MVDWNYVQTTVLTHIAYMGLARTRSNRKLLKGLSTFLLQTAVPKSLNKP